MSDGPILDPSAGGTAHRCNGCTKLREMLSGETWCVHPKFLPPRPAVFMVGRRIDSGPTNRTPDWCPFLT